MRKRMQTGLWYAGLGLCAIQANRFMVLNGFDTEPTFDSITALFLVGAFAIAVSLFLKGRNEGQR